MKKMTDIINIAKQNYIENVTDFDALKKEITQLAVVWVELYWFFGPELQLILIPICGRIFGMEFDPFYVATICHAFALAFGGQIVIKLIILCVDYVIGWHLKKKRLPDNN